MTDLWFRYMGMMNEFLGLEVKGIKSAPIPVRRGTEIVIPGRAGTVFLPEDGHESIETVIVCRKLPGFEMANCTLCLLGGEEEPLILSTNPDRIYLARVVKAEVEGTDITMRIRMQPYGYINPIQPDRFLTEPGRILNNGNMESEPVIETEASGDYTISINGETIAVTGGSVMIDSRERVCRNPEDYEEAFDRVTMEDFPLLDPGYNLINWEGNVTMVRVRVNARSL